MKFTNETWYRVVRTFLQAGVTVITALITQGALQSPIVTTILSAIALFISTALMNLEEIDNTPNDGV